MLLLLCFAALPLPTKAYSDFDYEIDHYQIQVTLAENNVATVQEIIDINYNRPRQGIFRVLPIKNKINKPINGQNKEMVYRTDIQNISVSAPFEAFEEDGFLYLQIGTEGEYLTGPCQYMISYTMDFGDDRIEEYDDVFFSLIGADWDAPIHKVSFRFEYPAAIDQNNIALYSGKYGNLDMGNAWFEFDGSTVVTGGTSQTLEPYEALTLYTMLPEGYFINETTINLWYVFVMGFVVFLIFFAILALAKNSKDSRNVVAVVNFYPPEDFTSAQVGYVIDSDVSDKEVLSLIIWMASKGYLYIQQEDEKNIRIRKNLEADLSNLPSHVKPIYDGIFSGEKEEVSLDKLNLYNAIQEVKQIIPSEFVASKKRYDTKYGVFGIVLGILGLIITVLTIVLSGAGIEEMPILAAVSCMFIGIFILVFSKVSSLKWEFLSGAKRRGFQIAIAIATLLGLFITAVCTRGQSFVSSWFLLAVCACGLLGVALGAFTDKLTDYQRKTAGQLLGLKEFIKQAEVSRIETLVHENPQYFFDILPYAYVLGLTDAWIKTFEQISVTPQCQYFGGYYGAGYYRMPYLYHALNQAQKTALPAMNTQQGGTFNSGGFQGSGFGGGFSGGGFGGGGGRSW